MWVISGSILAVPEACLVMMALSCQTFLERNKPFARRFRYGVREPIELLLKYFCRQFHSIRL
jgi:hypothetical protein